MVGGKPPVFIIDEANKLRTLVMNELLSARPFHGPKLRWRDVILCDLQSIGFDSTLWYGTVQNCAGWHDASQAFTSRTVPSVSGPVVVTESFVCECGRVFRRQGDHKPLHVFVIIMADVCRQTREDCML